MFLRLLKFSNTCELHFIAYAIQHLAIWHAAPIDSTAIFLGLGQSVLITPLKLVYYAF